MDCPRETNDREIINFEKLQSPAEKCDLIREWVLAAENDSHKISNVFYYGFQPGAQTEMLSRIYLRGSDVIRPDLDRITRSRNLVNQAYLSFHENPKNFRFLARQGVTYFRDQSPYAFLYSLALEYAYCYLWGSSNFLKYLSGSIVYNVLVPWRPVAPVLENNLEYFASSPFERFILSRPDEYLPNGLHEGESPIENLYKLKNGKELEKQIRDYYLGDAPDQTQEQMKLIIWFLEKVNSEPY